MPKWANNIASKSHFKCFRHSARQACLVFCCHATSECFIFGNVLSVCQMQRLVVHVLECLSHHGGVRSAGRLCHELGRYSLWWCMHLLLLFIYTASYPCFSQEGCSGFDHAFISFCVSPRRESISSHLASQESSSAASRSSLSFAPVLEE